MNGGYRMPSRVNAIKWLAVMQLIHGLLIFIISIVLFAIDFEATTRSPAVGDSGSFIIWTIPGFVLAFLVSNKWSLQQSLTVLHCYILVSFWDFCLFNVTVFCKVNCFNCWQAIGAGVAGAAMSRYEGLIHNVSSVSQ